MEEAFEIRLDWDKMSKKELDDYLFDLHSFLMDFSTSSINDMILALDDAARILTEDLHVIMSGEGQSKILNSDKDSKAYERLISLLSSVDKWKAVSTYAKELRPKVAKEKDKGVMEDFASGGGFEEIQKMIRKKRGE